MGASAKSGKSIPTCIASVGTGLAGSPTSDCAGDGVSIPARPAPSSRGGDGVDGTGDPAAVPPSGVSKGVGGTENAAS